jgi:tellurite resistance protein TerC
MLDGLSGEGWAMDINNIYLWAGFGAIILTLLVLDLGVFHRKSHSVSTKEAAIWTGVWVSLALLFNLVIYYWKGSETALEYLTGYLIEYSLSVDNLFVFVVIFGAFCVKPEQQHRVLFWGILGALIMRGVLIASGSFLMDRFFWVAYVFGAFLIFTGVKLWNKKESNPRPEKNLAVRIARRFLPMATDVDNGSFLVRRAGKLLVTPLFLVLLTVETTDLVFALDSIPAIFAITTDPLVIFTSNIFAILGLRSLYFLLARAVGKFHYLQTSLAVILSFVGTKMLISHWFKIPIVVSLIIVLTVLVAGIIASLIREKRLRNRSVPEDRFIKSATE